MTDNCYYSGPSPEFYKRIIDCTRPCYPPECNGSKGLVNKSSWEQGWGKLCLVDQKAEFGISKHADFTRVSKCALISVQFWCAGD